MAGQGPAPKDPDKRARRNAVPGTQDLAPDGELRGFPLPRKGFSTTSKVKTPDGWTSLREDHEWPDETRRWWLNWRKSAQAQTFTDSDWDFLLETALLHAQFWLGDNSVASELRLRVAKFGATPEDRARLRIRVTDPNASSPVEIPTIGGKPASQDRYGHLRVTDQ